MGASKIIYSGETLVDLTGDTVTAETLVSGVTAHNAAGEQIVGTAEYAEVDHTHDNRYLPLSGGTLTGNLSGRYMTGTWLQSTASNHQTAAASKICVQDSSGWIYHRTPEEILSDLGDIDCGTF